MPLPDDDNGVELETSDPALISAMLAHRRRMETLRTWTAFVNRHTLIRATETGEPPVRELDSDVETALNLALESACKLLDRLARAAADEHDPREG